MKRLFSRKGRYLAVTNIIIVSQAIYLLLLLFSIPLPEGDYVNGSSRDGSPDGVAETIEADKESNDFSITQQEPRDRISGIVCSDEHISSSPQDLLSEDPTDVVRLAPILDWGNQYVFTPSRKSIGFANTWNGSSVCISQLYSTNPNFHILGFYETTIAPGTMLKIDIIFTPSDNTAIEGLLVIQTSRGGISIHMQGCGVGIASLPPKRDAIGQRTSSLELSKPEIIVRLSKVPSNLPSPENGTYIWQKGLSVITTLPSKETILGSSKLIFPESEIGQKSTQWIQVRNPTDRPVSVQPIVSKSVRGMNCNLECARTGTCTFIDTKQRNSSDLQSACSITIESLTEIIVPPNSTHEIGPVSLYTYDACECSSDLVLLNNLTGIEWMLVEGFGASSNLAFLDGEKNVSILELEVDSRLLSSFSQMTLKERVERYFDEKGLKNVCHQRTTKQFLAKNYGKRPVQVDSLMLIGANGSSHGFRIDSFHGFHLSPGQSAKLIISHEPDFVNENMEADLQLVTVNGMLSITLRAKVPKNMLSFCQRALLVSKAKSVFLQICLVALLFVLLIFAKLLKQESVTAHRCHWPSAGNQVSKTSRHLAPDSIYYQDDKKSIWHKRPSIYISIDFGCTESDVQYGYNIISLVKSFSFLSAASTCKEKLKVICPPKLRAYVSNLQVAVKAKRNKMISRNSNSALETTNKPERKGSESTTDSQRKKPPSLNMHRGASPSRSGPKAKVVSSLEKIGAVSPTAAFVSVKGKKKRRKNDIITSMPADIEARSEGSCPSPLSSPSSPLKRNIVHSRPDLSLFSTSNRRPSQQEPAASHSSTMNMMEGLQAQVDEGHETEYVSNMPHTDAISVGRKTIKETHEMRTRTKCKARTPALTQSATFPRPGARSCSLEGITLVEDSEVVSVLSSCHSLTSTSAVAPHARAPGSPLTLIQPTISEGAQYESQRSCETLWYDIWKDHFVDIRRNMEDLDGCEHSDSMTATKLLPQPQLNTGFSIFSSNNPFNIVSNTGPGQKSLI